MEQPPQLVGREAWQWDHPALSWALSPGCPPALGIVWPWQGDWGGGQPGQWSAPGSQALLASWSWAVPGVVRWTPAWL